MSVSIDKDAAEDGADARGVLASWLDDYTAGRCDRAQMQASFLEICRGNPEAPWDALALLDQYQRRGRVDVALARSLKSDIAQLVFGVANQTYNEDTAEPAAATDSPTPHEPVSRHSTQQGSGANTPDAPKAPGVHADSSDTTGSRWRKLAEQRKAGAPKAEELFADPTHFRRDFDPLTRPPLTRSPITDRPSPSSSVLRDRYELLAILGRGSAGTVYKALDRHRANLSPSAQCVALKVLKLDYRDRSEALAQLEHEFHQAQSLAHPNIVSMFDLDRDRDTYFLVMELLEGELLADILRRLDHRPMARSQALAIIGSIGAALAHAHRRDVVHADLKPRNVMITATGEVKVLDFGFARTQALEPFVGDLRDDGLSGSRTPAYASAERVNGEPADSSDDVYSLACIAYELLAGRHPYGGRSATLARAHGRDPQRIAGLNGRQWNALRTALHWSRLERRIDIVELIAALGCADVEQQLILPHESFAQEDVGASGSMSRKLAVLALVLLAAAIGAGIFWSERWLPRETAPSASAGQDQGTTQPPAGAATSEAVTGANTASSAPAVQSPVPAPEVAAAPGGAPGTKSAASSTVPVTSPPAVSQPAIAPVASPDKADDKAAEKEESAADRTAAAGPSLIQFDKDTYVASESDGMVKLTVKRTGSIKHDATFRWSLQPNSAEPGSDYAAIGPLIEHIPAGSRTAVLAVPLVDDKIKERTEMFMVELAQEEGGPALGAQARAVVIIVDDD